MSDREYPPASLTETTIADALRTNPREFPIPTYDDRETWEAVRESDLTGPTARHVVSRAEAIGDEPVPSLPASLFLTYERTGEREPYWSREVERRDRLSLLAIAECLEGEGRFLDDVLDYAWAICEQETWHWPAHLEEPHYREGLPGRVPPPDRSLDFFGAKMGKLLAEIDYLFGDDLHPALREHVRAEAEEQVLAPYEEGEYYWKTATPAGNHNPVSNGAVVATALQLADDVDRQASIVREAIGSVRNYLEMIGADGAIAEGMSYWAIGVGDYLQMAEMLRTRTGGICDLLSPPIIERTAAFPLETELSPNRFPPISDSYEEESPWPYVVVRLGERTGRPELTKRGLQALVDHRPETLLERNTGVFLGGTLRGLVWSWESSLEPGYQRPDERAYFGGNQWWVARSEGDLESPVVVAKGGHNAEPHNHNDCGSFLVHVDGETLLADLGKIVYDADFFGEKRYEYLVARSLGHSVPYVNGTEQAPGEEYAAAVVDRTATEDRDGIAFDLTACYPENAGLESLRRAVALDRTATPRSTETVTATSGATEAATPNSTEVGTRIRVEDEATFEDGLEYPSFESILVSYYPMETNGNGLSVLGDSYRAAVTVLPEIADVDVERIPDGADGRDVWRARIAPALEAGTREVAVSMGVDVSEAE